MTTPDTSRIDHMEVRQQIMALDETRKVLAAAVQEADDAVEAVIAGEIEREQAIFEREVRERREAFNARCLEIRRAHGGGDKSAEAAIEAHDNAEAYSVAEGFDDEGQCFRCALTGLPILDGDDLVEDSEGRRALAAAIPGWPGFGPGDDETGAEDAA